MSAWYSKTCRNCFSEFRVHEEWDKVSDYCSTCQWHERDCEICSRSMRIHIEWENPPRVHKECREAEAAKWQHRSCKLCGTDIRYHQDWDNAPTVCKACKDAEAAKWFDKSCGYCGGTMRVNREWDDIPDYHKECAWLEKSCEICSRGLRVHRGWDNVPRSHKECLAEFAAKDVSCTDCGKYFRVSTGTQLKCRERNWDLPKRCEECKNDLLLIRGAIGAMKDQFPFALEATVEQHGIFFPEKVVVVRGKKSDDVVAEVKMDTRGFLVEYRVAEAYDPKTGTKLNTTREGTEGFWKPQRTADTYNRQGEQTHRTKMVEKGFWNPRRTSETRKMD